MKILRTMALAGVALQASAAYVYDYSNNPVIQDSVRWSSNGSPTCPSWGVNFASSGSLISIPTISAPSQNDYEVDTTLYLKSGGGT